MTTADIEPTNGSESNDDNINDDNNNNGSESEFEFESEPDDELYDLWPYDKEKVREWVIGCRVANDFDSQGVFHGKVVRVFNVEENSIKNALFQIKFDDGDSEDFNAIELYDGLLLYIKHVKKDCLCTARRLTTIDSTTRSHAHRRGHFPKKSNRKRESEDF